MPKREKVLDQANGGSDAFTARRAGRHRLDPFHVVGLIAAAVAMATASAAVRADNVGAVRYDPRQDQLIVTLIYDGTNPNHHFTTQWGRCHQIKAPGQPVHRSIALDILDREGNDAAKRRYTQTVTVSLADLSCRPATVTVWTPPGFFKSLYIPKRASRAGRRNAERRGP